MKLLQWAAALTLALALNNNCRSQETRPTATVAALQAAEARLLAPETAVTGDQLRSLVLLHLRIYAPLEPGHAAGVVTFPMMNMDLERPGYREALENYAGELVGALAGKQHDAQMASTLTLIQLPIEFSQADRLKIQSFVPEAFAALSGSRMTGVLNTRWQTIKSPELLPMLLKIYGDPPIDEQSPNYGSSQLIDACLKRIYELDPEKGRPLILENITNPQKFNSLWTQSLLILPDKTLPELDLILANQLANHPSLNSIEIASRLLSRYATDKVLPDVQKYFEPVASRLACNPQASLLAYFLRVDESYGLRMFAQCLASRQTGCWKNLFTEVGEHIWTPALEKLALRHLDDTNVDIPLSVAHMLLLKGSPAAKEALVAILAEPLVPGTLGTLDVPISDNPEEHRQQAFFRALLRGHNWVLTKEEIVHIQTLTMRSGLIEDCRKQAAETEITIEVNMPHNGGVALVLDGEPYATMDELQRKIGLYPAQTRFVLAGREDDPLRQQLLAWAAEKKLNIK